MTRASLPVLLQREGVINETAARLLPSRAAQIPQEVEDMTIVALQPLTGLARYRADLGLSQSQAAALAGISRARVQQLETGELVWTPAAIRLALAYMAVRVLIGAGPLLGSNGKEPA
jgi:DNA-binding XRE family transcriptional regulator